MTSQKKANLCVEPWLPSTLLPSVRSLCLLFRLEPSSIRVLLPERDAGPSCCFRRCKPWACSCCLLESSDLEMKMLRHLKMENNMRLVIKYNRLCRKKNNLNLRAFLQLTTRLEACDSIAADHRLSTSSLQLPEGRSLRLRRLKHWRSGAGSRCSWRHYVLHCFPRNSSLELTKIRKK